MLGAATRATALSAGRVPQAAGTACKRASAFTAGISNTTNTPRPKSTPPSSTNTTTHTINTNTTTNTTHTTNNTTTEAAHGFSVCGWRTWNRAQWWDALMVMTVFAITGSSTMRMVRPLLEHGLDLQGTMLDGPWSYRLAYLLTTLPLYSCTLITVGTLFGRQTFFLNVAFRMYARLFPRATRTRIQQYLRDRMAREKS